MERVKFYQRLQTIAEYLVAIIVFTLLIYAIGLKLFRLSLIESLGVVVTLVLIRIMYKMMGRMGKG